MKECQICGQETGELWQRGKELESMCPDCGSRYDFLKQNRIDKKLNDILNEEGL